MKLNEIRAFVMVARTGSIQAAANQLNMTQSAVSRLVQRLELELQATLLDRQSKPLTLTEDGRLAQDHGRRVLEAAEAFAEALAPAATPQGLLRIGTAHALAELVAGPPLDLLRANYPDLTLQVSVDWAMPLIARLEDGALDAALITLLTDGSPKTELPARRLGREAVRIIGASQLSPKRWASLAAMNEIGWVIQPEGCGYRTALTRALEHAGAGVPKIIVEGFGLELQRSVVARGAGFALVPASQLATLRDERTIKVFDVRDFDVAVASWFIRKPRAGRLTQPLDDLEHVLRGLVAKRLKRNTKPT